MIHSGRLQNKVALITGGGRGIGRGIALRFASEGAAVIITQRDQHSADATVSEILAAGGTALALGDSDVSNPAQVAQVVATALAHYGPLDILINNAGIAGSNGHFLQLSHATWQHIINVNLTGMFVCGQAVAQHMAEHEIKGRIVNIGSVNSLAAEPEAAAYVTSKHGIVGLTRAMATDLAAYGILVNCLAPGPITVERNASLFTVQQAAIRSAVPLGRPGTIDEVAAAALFLASDESGYITGSVLTIDGGMLSRVP